MRRTLNIFVVMPKVSKNIKSFFQRGLYAWSVSHPRLMPWKSIKDPYKIWISEIILQQTRVAQGGHIMKDFFL